MDIFLRVPSTEISSNSSTACAGKPQRTALIENPSSNEFFVRRRFFHSGSTSSTKIIHKKNNNPYHGFPCSWTSCNGIQLSIKCRIVTMCRVILVPSSLTRLCRVQHVTTSISSRGNGAVTTQCLVKNVPPASRCIIHAMCRFLQSCSDVRRMTCFCWQLTHNITTHTIRLSLKESCLKINGKDVAIFAGSRVTTHPKSRSCGSRRICLLTFLLFVLKTSQYPPGFCLEEVTLFVCLDGEHPSPSHIISRLNLPHVDEIKNLVINPGFLLLVLCFSKLFVVSSYYTINSLWNFSIHVAEVGGLCFEVQ